MEAHELMAEYPDETAGLSALDVEEKWSLYSLMFGVDWIEPWPEGIAIVFNR